MGAACPHRYCIQFVSEPLLFIKIRVDVAQYLQTFSYEVCSHNIGTIFRTRITHYDF